MSGTDSSSSPSPSPSTSPSPSQSAPSPLGFFQTNVQEGIISACLNSAMLFNFLIGLYTMVYAGTLYLYMTRIPFSRARRAVTCALTLLYIFCGTQCIVAWYALNLTVVTNGDTRLSIVLSVLTGGSQSVWALGQVMGWMAVVLADGFLIWRCYMVWGQSLRIIFIPLGLLVAETALFITSTVLSSISHALTARITSTIAAILSTITNNKLTLPVATALAQQFALLDELDATSAGNTAGNAKAAAAFVSLGATAITAFLIWYRLVCDAAAASSLSQVDSSNFPASPPEKMKGKAASKLMSAPRRVLVRIGAWFARVGVLCIESGAVYALVLLVSAIMTLLSVMSPHAFGSSVANANTYVSFVLTFAAGMTPTLIIAHTVLCPTVGGTKSVSPVLSKLSGLQFQYQSQNRSGTRTHATNTTTGGEVVVSFHTAPEEPWGVEEKERAKGIGIGKGIGKGKGKNNANGEKTLPFEYSYEV